MTRRRWSIWLGLLGALVCVCLQAGFYWSANRALFLDVLTTVNFAVIPVANWIVSKWSQAGFLIRKETIAFEALLPILSGLQWMLIGAAIDFVRPELDRRA